MASPKQRHPVVEAFANSSTGICQALARVGVYDTSLLKAMRAFCECLRGKAPFPDALKEAEAVTDDPGTDPELFVLFLSMWMEASNQQRRIQEMTALQRRIESLVTKATSPEIRAVIPVQQALLATTLGDKIAADRAREAALGLLPRNSPRYRSGVWHRAMGLAFDGRAAAMDEALTDLAAASGGIMRSRTAMARLVNAVETAHFGEGMRFLSDVEGDPELAALMARNIRISRQLLGRMPVWLKAAPVRATTLVDADRDQGADSTEVALMIKAVDLLVDGKPHEALACVRQLSPAGLEDCIRGSNLLTFNLVRAELATGSAGAAKRALSLRHERGNHHYLDDLFLARAALLEGYPDLAARHFALVLESCRRYRAEPRLELELRLAAELSPLQLARVAAEAATCGHRPDSAARRSPAPRPSLRPAEARGLDRLVGGSPALASIREAILRLAPLGVTVLITGETGTGKELVARAIHESGPHAGEPFIAVNCGAIADTLLESELFGHERGAFTGAVKARRGLFEEAGHGTLLLDEIGEISPRLQVALLRVLETGEIRPVGSSGPRRTHCRVLAATNADLPALAEKGLFRKDLLFRLRRMELPIPPLRERREDILPLAEHFLAHGRTDGRHPDLTTELRDALRDRDWPGNVRELRGAVETMRLLHSDALHYGLESLAAALPKERARPEVAASGPGSEPAQPKPAPAQKVRGAADALPSADIDAVLRQGRTALRRLERLRAIFQQHRTLTRAEVASALGISPTTATADLKALCSEGLIERVEPSASTRSHYFVLSGPKAARPPSP